VETHRDLVGLALDHRVPTIVQKPFGPGLADCIAMAQAARKAGVFLAVHENFRFQAPMLKVAEHLAEIGPPTWARIAFRTGFDVYKGQPYLQREERLVILDLGVHVLDLARVFLGEAEHICAELQKRNPGIAGEDTATMLVKHRKGGVSVVECTYEARRIPDCFPETLVEIEGPKGSIVLAAGYAMTVSVGGKARTIDADAPLLPWTERPWHVVQESVRATCAHMLERLRQGQEADTSAADNLATFALCEAAYESAAAGRAVRPRNV
jgi:predicted dehydrogenase